MIPLPTQTEDAAFLAASPRLRGSMFSAPGTGKTITALEAVKRLNLGKQWVVLAPPIALRMWGQNIENHLGAKAQVLRTGKDRLDPGADFYVVSYGLLPNFIDDLRKCGAGIADEADALKTLSSARTKSVYGNRASGKNCLIENFEAFFPLTGTPMRRYADDLYPWFRALHPSVLKREGITSLKGYQDMFCVTSMKRYHPRMPMKPQIIGNKNESLLRSMIYGQGGIIKRPALAKRRLLADVAQFMPDKVERVIEVSFDDSPELRKASNLVDYDDLDEGILTTARRLLGVAKAPYVAEYLIETAKERDGGLLVLYWHKEVAAALSSFMEKHALVYGVIDGATPTKTREQLEDRFNGGGLDILFGQIQSMGVSLNLQRGSNSVVFAERDWSPSSQEQGYARVWRMGQDQKVMIDYCLADHPIEEALTAVNQRKAKSSNIVIG